MTSLVLSKTLMYILNWRATSTWLILNNSTHLARPNFFITIFCQTLFARWKLTILITRITNLTTIRTLAYATWNLSCFWWLSQSSIISEWTLWVWLLKWVLGKRWLLILFKDFARATWIPIERWMRLLVDHLSSCSKSLSKLIHIKAMINSWPSSTLISRHISQIGLRRVVLWYRRITIFLAVSFI